jgi:hypothetical protein
MASEVFIGLDLDGSLAEGEPHRHVTLIPPVKLTDEALSLLRSCLANELQDFGRVPLVGTEEDRFGATSHVQVRRVKLTPQLRTLHDITLGEAVNVSSNIDMTYTGDRWEPHVTDQGERGLGEGESHLITGVTLFRRGDQGWVPDTVISLVGSEGVV